MKKVLIVTYYWPPSGGSGVQRWLKFTKYLPENGWHPIIYTPESPQFELLDPELTADIPDQATIWEAPIREPYHLKNWIFGHGGVGQNAGVVHNRGSMKHRFLSWVRGNIFIPDPRILWVKPSIKALKRKIIEHEIGVVVTTGPPHSMHLIGLGLKKSLDIRWIADFRDPWSEMDVLHDYHLTKSSRSKHKALEKEVLQTADLCLTVSKSWAKSFKRLGARQVEVITNGFDDEDRIDAGQPQDRFIIGHYGLLNHLRNPIVLWDSLNEKCKTDPQFDAQLEIHLAGMVDESVIRTLQDFPLLKSKTRILGYLSHQQVLKEYSKASVLLLLAFDSESGAGNIPAKVFEYFASGRPILSFGPEESDLQELIADSKRGVHHRYAADPEAVSKDVSDLFERKMSAENLEPIEKFCRRRLARSLAELLHD